MITRNKDRMLTSYPQTVIRKRHETCNVEFCRYWSEGGRWRRRRGRGRWMCVYKQYSRSRLTATFRNLESPSHRLVFPSLWDVYCLCLKGRKVSLGYAEQRSDHNALVFRSLCWIFVPFPYQPCTPLRL